MFCCATPFGRIAAVDEAIPCSLRVSNTSHTPVRARLRSSCCKYVSNRLSSLFLFAASFAFAAHSGLPNPAAFKSWAPRHPYPITPKRIRSPGFLVFSTAGAFFFKESSSMISPLRILSRACFLK